MTAKCKVCGAALPAETIERMLERFEQCDERTLALFTVGECESDVDRDIIRNQWPALIRGLMAKADQRPVLTPETVDEIDPKVCEAVWQSFAPPVDLESVDDHEYEIADMGREMLRAVAAHCRVPQPSSDSGQLDTAEADRLLADIPSLLALRDVHADKLIVENVDRLRSRLTLKPRRLSETEDRKLVEFARRACLPGYINAGHAIAAEVVRLWGLEVPEERPARALSDEEADELLEFSTYRNAYDSFKRDGHAIYAEALRLAGRKVEAEPVASVELSEAIVEALSERWPNMQMEGWDDDEAGAIINRILAARSARDVADMRPPFEGPKHGFAVPDEANANVNGPISERNADALAAIERLNEESAELERKAAAYDVLMNDPLVEIVRWTRLTPVSVLPPKLHDAKYHVKLVSGKLDQWYRFGGGDDANWRSAVTAYAPPLKGPKESANGND